VDSEDEEFVRHLQSLNVADAPPVRRTGLDRNTEEGALLHFSGALRGDNPRHRRVAWVLLVVFGFHVVTSLGWVLFHLVRWVWAQAS